MYHVFYQCISTESPLTFQITFLGVSGRDVRRVIAIDKLKIFEGLCPGNTTFAYMHLYQLRHCRQSIQLYIRVNNCVCC